MYSRFRPVLILALCFLCFWGYAAPSNSWGPSEQRTQTFEEVVEVFRRNYWDPDYLNWQEWAQKYRQRAMNASTRAEFDTIMGEMVRELDDEHSTWLGLIRDSLEANQRYIEEPRYGFRRVFAPGLGIVIERVYAGSPVSRAGLRRGDVIRSINGYNIAHEPEEAKVWELLGLAREGGDVLFEIGRLDSVMQIRVHPEPFDLLSASALPQAEMLSETLGYMYIPTFNHGAVAIRVHRLLAELEAQGMEELVLDLRGNMGGRIGELGLTLGAFLDGTWARAIGRDGLVWEGKYATNEGRGMTWLEDPHGVHLHRQELGGPVRFRGPIAVLVNGSNSSAGEVAPLVLQAQRRAVIIGEPTGGNVEAIQSFDLPDGSVVMVAIANIEGSDGSDFAQGLMPDKVVSEDIHQLASGFDAPLALAVRLLGGPPFMPLATPGVVWQDSENYLTR